MLCLYMMFFFYFHRNQRRPYVFLIEMTITVYMVRMLIWLPKSYSNQQLRWRLWHPSQTDQASTISRLAKAISKSFCVNSCSSKTIALKFTPRKPQRPNGHWNSKDRPEIWYNSKIYSSTTRKWSLDHRSFQLTWNKVDNRRYLIFEFCIFYSIFFNW